MLQLIIGFILGAIAATVYITSGLGQRIYDYTSASDYPTEYTAPTAAPTYSAEPPANGSYNAQEPANAYQAPYQAPYEAPAAGYPGAAASDGNSAPLNISVVPMPASPGGDNSCSAYALSNRTNQAIVISYADAQRGFEAAGDDGVVVQPGETKVAAVSDDQRRQRAYGDDRYSYGDPLYRQGPSDDRSRNDGSDDTAESATCATIEVKY